MGRGQHLSHKESEHGWRSSPLAKWVPPRVSHLAAVLPGSTDVYSIRAMPRPVPVERTGVADVSAIPKCSPPKPSAASMPAATFSSANSRSRPIRSNSSRSRSSTNSWTTSTRNPSSSAASDPSSPVRWRTNAGARCCRRPFPPMSG